VGAGVWQTCSLGWQVTGQPTDLGAQLSVPVQASPVQSGGGMMWQKVSSAAQVRGHAAALHQLVAMPSGMGAGVWQMCSLGGQATGQPKDLGTHVSAPEQASPVQPAGGTKGQDVSSSAQVTGHGTALHQL